MNRRLAATLVWLAAAPLAAQTPIVTTVLNNGTTQSRYDMVILGDGYQASEQTKFNTDVTTFLTYLFAQQPYATFANYFNVHTVFRASNQSGADQPDVTPPIFVDTAYDSTYNTGGVDRCLYIGDTALGLADAALAPATEGRVLVMVNSTRYGGCASTFAVSYTGGSMSQVQIHELGHSLGGLADEYDYPNDTYTGAEPSQANVTISPTGAKWSHWWGTDSISSTAFEGARYYLHGLYRPRNNCMMRSLGITLCAVCREQIVKLTNSVVDAIVTTTPATAAVTLQQNQVQTFSFTHIVPAANVPLISWRLDGAIVPGAIATSFVLDASTLTTGAHTLTAEVLDQSTFVRNDPSLLMRETHTWNLTVNAPPLAQLRVPAFTSSLVWVQPGNAPTLTVTVRNDGNAAAGPFALEFFLSPSTTAWSTQDIYLGSVPITGLAPGTQTVVVHTPQLPWSLPPAIWFVHAVVDRTNTIAESVETDNSRFATLVGQTGPCVTKLEFDDPLLHPRDFGSMSVAAGGQLHPTVVAPCADPLGTLYVILWGGSGTSPGIPLSPNALLPLNPDGYTDLGLALLNGPELGGFLGIFDAQGLGHATFTLPPAIGLPTATTHFAAVLMTGTELFAAATNPVTLQFVP
ncbi:MAG: hypothetical protein JNL08_07775 [Planctomycetes bacterium]|nr:hypothetical protein [Planctomycetota bacterium]